MTLAPARGAALSLGLLASLAACEATTGGSEQRVALPYEQCISRIEETAERRGLTPGVLVDTSDQRMVRFDDEGEMVRVTCDRMLGTMIVQTRPAAI